MTDFQTRRRVTNAPRLSWAFPFLSIPYCVRLARRYLQQQQQQQQPAIGALNSRDPPPVVRFCSFLMSSLSVSLHTMIMIMQMWTNTPLNELDLTKSEKGGPSYRHLPKNFPLLSCSEVGKARRLGRNSSPIPAGVP